MRRLFVALAIAASACATKTVPLPNDSAPRFQDFVEPTVPESFSRNPAAVASQQRGWRFLQAADFSNAEREFDVALKAAPDFYPAETSLGYLALAQKDAKAALPHFEKALAANARYVPALVGGGQAFLALGRDRDALFAFQSALAVDPSLADVRRRVDVLQFRGVERELADARQDVKDGKFDDAIKAFQTAIQSSPDSGFLYRELADAELKRGNTDNALTDLQKAIALDSGDAAAMVQIGDLLAGRGDFDGAARWYGEAVVIDPSDAVEAKLDAAKARAEAEHLPAEYKALESAPQVTRGDLAGLIGIRLSSLVQAARQKNAVVITDMRNHWASSWIVPVVRAGIMDAFANHTFQPRAIVRRSDLALAMSRLLARVAAQNPGVARSWQGARLKFADLPPAHLAYPAASMAVAAGVMNVDADNRFQPSKAVTGSDAVAAVSRIEALAADARK